MQGIAILSLTIIVVLLLPVIVPVVALLHWLYRKRLSAAARTFACLSCGRMLGREAIRLGDAVWDEYMRELCKTHPSIHLRLVRHIHAVCPACGARYMFLERERTFVRTRADGCRAATGEVREAV